MSYHGLGSFCDSQTYSFKPPHLGSGKGCPSGMLQVETKLPTSTDLNGRTTCATELSCVAATSTAPPTNSLPASKVPAEEYPAWAPWALGAAAAVAVLFFATR